MKQFVFLFAALACLNFLLLRAAEPEPTFESQIRPILKAFCTDCHGESPKLKGGLDVRLKHLIQTGGNNGSALIPGKPDDSPLFTRVRDQEMPPGKVKLKPQEVELIRRWILSGAKTEGPEPESLKPGLVITADDRAWWSFQPIARKSPPTASPTDRLRTGVDAWIFQQLKGQNLAFNPEASRRTLIRRASLDLIGLPPTLSEIEAFEQDRSPDAYEKVIDRLLASPAYGERWGRHWLDVAGYADSEGYDQADPIRKNAWKYRDYVIRCFNEDRAFDRFIREQLAGDELIGKPLTNLSPTDQELLIATGFLRMAPDGSGNPGADPKLTRNQVITDTVKIISSSFLGMTVGCAECHNHRYDPIPQTDFYRLRAILEPGWNLSSWKTPAARQISLMSSADRKAADVIEVQAKAIEAERLKKQTQFIEATLEKEFNKLPEDIRSLAREAKALPAAKLSVEQKKLLSRFPNLNVNPGSLYLYDKKAADELKAMAEKAAATRAKKPKEEFVRAFTEEHGKLPVTHLFHRGDPDQPKEVVDAGTLTVLESAIPFDLKLTQFRTSGRRLALANWLVDRRNPLTARVLVNRVWMHHFGRGLVATPDDFGRLGEKPTHPELLDWLAFELIENGWSMKKLHKLIMTSTVYRQSSKREERINTIDPDNRLLGRFPLLRLEAEALRDSILSVSGRLNAKTYGPPVPVMEDDFGQIVLGMANRDGAGYKLGDEALPPEELFRRSIYVQVRRSQLLTILDTFDGAVVEPNCTARNRSTIALQSLFLLNNEWIISQSETMVDRLKAEAGSDRTRQIAYAWRLAYGVEPTTQELKRAESFVRDMEKQLAQKHQAQPVKVSQAPVKGMPKTNPVVKGTQLKPGEQAMAAFCQTLLISNRFVYVD